MRCTNENASMLLGVRRHEQTAVHAADGYAPRARWVWHHVGPRATERGHRHRDGLRRSIPMVIISARCTHAAIGLDTFRVQHRRHPPPIVKHNFLVRTCDLALTLKKAFHIARTSRPARRWWTFRMSFQRRTTAAERGDALHHNPGRERAADLDPARPCNTHRCQAPLLTGGGIAAAFRQCHAGAARLVDMLGYPVTEHADGPGRLPATDKFLGMMGAARARSEANNTMPELRRAAGRGLAALRRPRDQQPQAFRAKRPQDHPTVSIASRDTPEAREVDGVPIVGDVREVLTSGGLHDAQGAPLYSGA